MLLTATAGRLHWQLLRAERCCAVLSHWTVLLGASCCSKATHSRLLTSCGASAEGAAAAVLMT